MGVLDPPVVPSRLNRAGLASALPPASAALAGVTWTYTDTGSATYTGRVDRCDGSAWVMIVPPTGTSVAVKGKTADLPAAFIGAHRGSTNLYPENTMEGFRAAIAAGAQALVVPTHMLADGQFVVTHDSTFDRTTSYTGGPNVESVLSSKVLSTYVQGSKTLPGFGFPDNFYRVPFLAQVLAEFGGRINIWVELKTSTAAARTALLALLDQYPVKQSFVLQSFSYTDCTTFAAAGYATDYLDATGALTGGGGPGSAAAVAAAGITFVSSDYTQVADATVTALLAAGLKVVPYVVNRRKDRDHFIGLGCQGVISDSPVYLLGQGMTTDPFSQQTVWPGMFANDSVYQGVFVSTNRWGIGSGASGTDQTVLQGWVKIADPTTYTLTATATFDNITTGFGVIGFGFTDDTAINGSAGSASGEANGYWLRIRPSNTSQATVTLFQRNKAGADVQIGSAVTGSVLTSGQAITLAIAVSSAGLTVTVSGALTGTITSAGAAAKAYRGSAVHFGRGGSTTQQASFSAVSIV